MAESDFKRGKIYTATLDQIRVVPDYNIRTIPCIDEDIQLRESVRESGTRTACIGKVSGDTILMRSGHRRLRANLHLHFNYRYPQERVACGRDDTQDIFVERVLHKIFNEGAGLIDAIESVSSEYGEPKPDEWGWDSELRSLRFTTEGIDTTDEDRIYDPIRTNDGKRPDLYEEGSAYARAAAQYNRTPEQIAQKVGRSGNHVRNAIRVFTTPGSVKVAIEGGLISSSAVLAICQQHKDDAEIEKAVKQALSAAKRDLFDKPEKVKTSDVKPPSLAKVWNAGVKYVETEAPIETKKFLTKFLKHWEAGEYEKAITIFEKQIA